MVKFLKGAASVVTGVALAASVTVGAELPATAASSCDATFSKYQTISKGSTGAQAKAVECLLTNAGHRASVNGSFSASDAAKLATFRTSVGLSPLKVADSRTWSALLSRGTTPSLKSGAKGAEVLRLQRSLRSVAYSVPTTGAYEARTTAAVKAIQKARGLARTGIADVRVWKALQAGKVAGPAKTASSSTTSTATSSSAKTSAARRTKGQKALAYAKAQLGERYRRGAAGPNAWDCSGLTMKAWRSAGVKLPHSAKQQYRKGRKVSKSNLRPGDLVFFYSAPSHVSIYAGGGKVIHASRPGKPVAYIKMKYMPYKGARRPG